MEYVILFVLLIIFLGPIYYFYMFNQLIKLNNKLKESFATMDVYLKKRWDLIPNILESVKGYSNLEKDSLAQIVSIRNGNYDSLSVDDKIKANEKVNAAISKIMTLAESYPKLKADKNFLILSTELTKIEDEIAQSRKYYNAVVRMYNNKVEMIPSNIIAKILGYKVKNMYMAEEYERNSIKVRI